MTMNPKYERSGMTLFKEVDDKLVVVANFEHDMGDDMYMLVIAHELLESLERLVLAFDVGDMKHTSLNGRGYAALADSRETIRKAKQQ